MAAHWNGACGVSSSVPDFCVEMELAGGSRQVRTYAVHPLACRAVTVLGRQGLLALQLVLHGAAVALALPLDVELVGTLVDQVWSSELPLILLTVGARASLVLMRLVAVAALVAVLVLAHLCEYRRRGDVTDGLAVYCTE